MAVGNLKGRPAFIKQMKDKTRKKSKVNVLHKGDEGHNKKEKQGECPS